MPIVTQGDVAEGVICRDGMSGNYRIPGSFFSSQFTGFSFCPAGFALGLVLFGLLNALTVLTLYFFSFFSCLFGGFSSGFFSLLLRLFFNGFLGGCCARFHVCTLLVYFLFGFFGGFFLLFLAKQLVEQTFLFCHDFLLRMYKRSLAVIQLVKSSQASRQ
jgi:hypothetical protein